MSEIMQDGSLSPADWREIESYARAAGNIKIDEDGAIWLYSGDVLRACIHPRTFLDMCREVGEQHNG